MKKRLSFLSALIGLVASVQAQESVYKSRLELIPSKVPLTWNAYVEVYINAYLSDKSGTEVMLGKGRFYLKTID